MALQSANRTIAKAKTRRDRGLTLTLGYFGYVTNQLDGQTVKTRMLHQLIEDKVPNSRYFDTQRLRVNRWSVLTLIGLLLRARRVFFLPSYKSLKWLLPPLYLMSRVCRFEIYYFVVGGGLVDFVAKRPLHRAILSRIKAILSETELICEQLSEQYGFSNTSVLYNFRPRSEIRLGKRRQVNPQNIKLVFMSRINKSKGLEALFDLAASLENSCHVSIDFYGPISDADKAYFLEHIQKYANTSYRGVLEPSEITSTLVNYDVLLFPTKFYTEGLPGALIDAYFSGLTVVASDWQYASEFIRHNETGLISEWNDIQDFIDKVSALVKTPTEIERLKENAATEVSKYTSEAAWVRISEIVNAARV